MTFPTLASDFYGFEALLADHERDALVRLRTFLEAEVKPVVNDYWERAEFPREILPGLHEQQVFGNLWEETKAGDYSAVYGGWTALEMARVDASIATYVGVQNGLAMGSIGVAGSPEQRTEWLPKLKTGEVVGASGSPSGSPAATRPRASARRPPGMATSGCSTARSGGSATPRGATSRSSGRRARKTAR